MSEEKKPEMRKEARDYLAFIHKSDVEKVMLQVLVLKDEKVELDGMNNVQIADLYRLLKQYFSGLDKL